MISLRRIGINAFISHKKEQGGTFTSITAEKSRFPQMFVSLKISNDGLPNISVLRRGICPGKKNIHDVFA